jgi:hypothetical protein
VGEGAQRGDSKGSLVESDPAAEPPFTDADGRGGRRLRLAAASDAFTAKRE